MIKKSAVELMLRLNALAPIRFLNRGRLLILMYHRFSGTEEVGKTSKAVFAQHLAYLKRYYFPISLTEAVGRIENQDAFPPRSVVITIDDGYADFVEVAIPILKEFCIPATIYLVTDFVGGKCWIWTDKARFLLMNAKNGPHDFELDGERFVLELNGLSSRLASAGRINARLKAMADPDKERHILQMAGSLGLALPDRPPAEFAPLTWDQADEISKHGVAIGSHTVSHPILTNVDEARLKTELERSYSAVAPFSREGAPHFCYPNGNVSKRERDAASEAGFASAVTTEIRLCNNREDVFMLPRIDAEPEMYRFAQATSGFDAFKSRGPRKF